MAVTSAASALYSPPPRPRSMSATSPCSTSTRALASPSVSTKASACDRNLSRDSRKIFSSACFATSRRTSRCVVNAGKPVTSETSPMVNLRPHLLHLRPRVLQGAVGIDDPGRHRHLVRERRLRAQALHRLLLRQIVAPDDARDLLRLT